MDLIEAALFPAAIAGVAITVWLRRRTGWGSRLADRGQKSLRERVTPFLEQGETVHVTARLTAPYASIAVVTNRRFLVLRANWRWRVKRISYTDSIDGIRSVTLADGKLGGKVPVLVLSYVTTVGVTRDVAMSPIYRNEAEMMVRLLPDTIVRLLPDPTLAPSFHTSPLVESGGRRFVTTNRLVLAGLVVSVGVGLAIGFLDRGEPSSATPLDETSSAAILDRLGSRGPEVKVAKGDCVTVRNGQVRVVSCTTPGAAGRVLEKSSMSLMCPGGTEKTIDLGDFQALCLGPPRTKSVAEARRGDCLRVPPELLDRPTKVVSCASKGAYRIVAFRLTSFSCPKGATDVLELFGGNPPYRVICLRRA